MYVEQIKWLVIRGILIIYVSIQQIKAFTSKETIPK